eukprot:TRINITY_DN26811_c0_g2_i1.p1 TRINITY_DN26811_c0_g2~~TRINITY_DN26811_c0_g2_i1.p1  ORF type:complete len:452 (+),score=86.53 TRINITY_DN26811_c0_g2_i1:80-1357(+)
MGNASVSAANPEFATSSADRLSPRLAFASQHAPAAYASSISSIDNYAAIDQGKIMGEMMYYFRVQASLVWLFLPALAVMQFVSPVLRPSCITGFRDELLLGVVFVVAHHFYAESRAWTAAKALLTPPEVTVMRHLGVLRKRQRLVALGVLEDLDIYTDLVFPAVAFGCAEGVATEWIESWEHIPFVGHFLGSVVNGVPFWTVATGVCAVTWSLELAMLLKMFSTQVGGGSQNAARVSGENFFQLAHFAEMAVMPSVAELCEAMAAQKRWAYDASKDTHQAHEARKDYIFGKKHDYTELTLQEVRDHAEAERTDSAGRAFFAFHLTVRIIMGHVVQLFVQSSFLMLAFAAAGEMAKGKVVISMALSALQVISKSMRSAQATSELGCLGCFFSLVALIMVSWTIAKVYFIFKCEDHLWTLSAGCLKK